MYIRKAVTASTLIFSLIAGLVGFRLFPFSNYSMFSWLKSDASTFALYAKDQKSNETLLGPSNVYPFSLLHIAHMAYSQADKPTPNYEWMRALGERYKLLHPNTRTIVLKKVTFLKNPDSQLEIIPNQTRIIYELAL